MLLMGHQQATDSDITPPLAGHPCCCSCCSGSLGHRRCCSGRLGHCHRRSTGGCSGCLGHSFHQRATDAARVTAGHVCCLCRLCHSCHRRATDAACVAWATRVTGGTQMLLRLLGPRMLLVPLKATRVTADALHCYTHALSIFTKTAASVVRLGCSSAGKGPPTFLSLNEARRLQ